MGRIVDRGAIAGGWVGLGMAAVIVLSFELVIPLQSLVFLMAPFGGVLIGYYANTRGERPVASWRRIVANALYAGLVTGVSLALLYGAIRFLFVYADDGYRAPSEGGRIVCSGGPDCSYRRYLADPAQAQQLRDQGITDAASFESHFVRQQLDSGVLLTILPVGAALFGALLYGASRPRDGSAPGTSAAPGATPAG